MEEKKKRKSKQFVEQPQYPGGPKALSQFIKENLRYPEDAIRQRIEGTVRIAYQVNDDGIVENASIVKGLSPSCDAEALRLVRSLKYGAAYNRGIRLKSNCKININFHLTPVPAKPTIQVSFTPKKAADDTKKSSNHFSYSITIKS